MGELLQVVGGGYGSLDAALANAQVSTLLRQPGAITGDAWFGPSATQNALDPQALHAMGVGVPLQAPLVDITLRAAAASGAAVRSRRPSRTGP